MLTWPSSIRVYVATEPMDVRKSFDGLSAAAQHVLEKDPMSGHLFVFFNRRGNQVRCLFWDRTGYCILAKRLARGTFRFAEQAKAGGPCVQIEAAELALSLEGIELRGALRRARWRPHEKDEPIEQPPNNPRPARSRKGRKPPPSHLPRETRELLVPKSPDGVARCTTS